MRSIFLIFILFFAHSYSYAGCYRSFDKLLADIVSSDKILENISENYYISEVTNTPEGSVKNKLESIPKKYTYSGRIFPSYTQQKQLNMTTYLRRVVFKDSRVVTEKNIKTNHEPSSYWFKRISGCWKLTHREIYVNR